MVDCHYCFGLGFVRDGTKSVRCPRCNGSGRKRSFFWRAIVAVLAAVVAVPSWTSKAQAQIRQMAMSGSPSTCTGIEPPDTEATISFAGDDVVGFFEIMIGGFGGERVIAALDFELAEPNTLAGATVTAIEGNMQSRGYNLVFTDTFSTFLGGMLHFEISGPDWSCEESSMTYIRGRPVNLDEIREVLRTLDSGVADPGYELDRRRAAEIAAAGPPEGPRSFVVTLPDPNEGAWGAPVWGRNSRTANAIVAGTLFHFESGSRFFVSGLASYIIENCPGSLPFEAAAIVGPFVAASNTQGVLVNLFGFGLGDGGANFTNPNVFEVTQQRFANLAIIAEGLYTMEARGCADSERIFSNIAQVVLYNIPSVVPNTAAPAPSAPVTKN